MKTIKKLSVLGTALLMTASMGSVYADESDASHTRTQDRVHTELNLQAATSDVGQSQSREEHTVMNENKNQYQYKQMNKFQHGDTGSAAGSSKSQNAEYNIWQGYTTANTMNRMNTTNRSMGSGRH